MLNVILQKISLFNTFTKALDFWLSYEWINKVKNEMIESNWLKKFIRPKQRSKYS